MPFQRGTHRGGQPWRGWCWEICIQTVTVCAEVQLLLLLFLTLYASLLLNKKKSSSPKSMSKIGGVLILEETLSQKMWLFCQHVLGCGSEGCILICQTPGRCTETTSWTSTFFLTLLMQSGWNGALWENRARGKKTLHVWDVFPLVYITRYILLPDQEK